MHNPSNKNPHINFQTIYYCIIIFIFIESNGFIYKSIHNKTILLLSRPIWTFILRVDSLCYIHTIYRIFFYNNPLLRSYVSYNNEVILLSLCIIYVVILLHVHICNLHTKIIWKCSIKKTILTVWLAYQIELSYTVISFKSVSCYMIVVVNILNVSYIFRFTTSDFFIQILKLRFYFPSTCRR